MSRTQRRFRPLVEKLEDRTAPAGNVTAFVSGGSLFVFGDAQANRISISSAGGKNVAISSLDLTTTINGTLGLILGGYKKGAYVALGEGDDLLMAIGLTVKKDLFVDMGGGADTLIAGGTVVKKAAVVSAGAGDDNVAITGSKLGNNSSLDGGTGNNTLTFNGNKTGKNLTITNFGAPATAPAPTAANDTGTVAEGGTTTISVTANDTAPGSTLDLTSITITQPPTNGNVAVNIDGTITYTHNGSETTTDTFQYTIRNAQGTVSAAATVTVTVTPVNDAPIAVNDTATVTEGGTTTINVASNDTDPEGQLDLTSIVITQQPTNGTATVNANGTITYTHNGTETLTDTFRYTIEDAQGVVSTAAATVNVTITPVNDAPTANADTATVAEGGNISINAAGNDTDPENQLDPTSIVIVQPPANGSVVVNANGTITYTHNGGETTTDTFTYTIEDVPGLVSNTATVTITITPVNDAPIAANDAATVLSGGMVTIDLALNDTDPENQLDLTSIVITVQPQSGTLVLNGDGTVTYTHDGLSTTPDSFSYTIEDALNAVSNVAVVNITIT